VTERRLRWSAARLAETRDETPAARTLVFEVPGWPGHRAGQHVDVRLTAEDGYAAQRSYSIAAPADGDRIELTVQRVEDGEVSPYLVDAMEVGDRLEVRGPIGGWFAWPAPPDQDSGVPEAVLLIGGGSGVVPLRAMLRQRERLGSSVPFRLVYSVRTPEDVYYDDELRRPAGGVRIDLLYTRDAGAAGAPGASARPAGRITGVDLDDEDWTGGAVPRVYVCGPTGFVEHVADLLVDLGQPSSTIRTERFGPSGG
jgi:ferredoxin-NADP reductase